MEFAQISATVRKADGKGPARRLRLEGKIPAVCYGRGFESTPLAVSPIDLVRILKGVLGRNTVMKLMIEGGQEILVMVRDFQRHPIGRELMHADFIQVKLDEEIVVEVPLVTTGKANGVTKGGVLNVVYRRIPVRCRPDHIPVEISIDVTELEMGEGLTAAKITTLPKGVQIALEQNQTIVSVTAPEKEPAPEEAAAAATAEAAAAPAEGAAGAAPAAGGAKPAAGGKPAAGAAPAGGDKKEADKGGKKEKK